MRTNRQTDRHGDSSIPASNYVCGVISIKTTTKTATKQTKNNNNKKQQQQTKKTTTKNNACKDTKIHGVENKLL